MSKQAHLGYVISNNDDWVVREKYEDGKVKLVVHSKVDGQEALPHGYVLGSNALIFEVKR